MKLVDDAKSATQLAPGVTLGVLHEAATDPDVMCLAVGALLTETRFKGLGKAFMTYFAMRQIGHLALFLGSKADRLIGAINGDS